MLLQRQFNRSTSLNRKPGDQLHTLHAECSRLACNKAHIDIRPRVLTVKLCSMPSEWAVCRAEQALPNTPRRAEVMLQDKPDVQVLRVSDKSDKSEDRAQHRQDAERRAYLRTLTETQRAGLRHSAAAAPAKGPKKALQWLTFHSSWYEDCESKDLLFRCALRSLALGDFALVLQTRSACDPVVEIKFPQFSNSNAPET